MKTVPSEDDVECCVLEDFQKGVSTLPRFLHKRVAGNMQPLTRGGAGMFRWGDHWLLILVRRKFQKFSKEVSKKLESGHLKVKGENDDDDLYAGKFSGGGVILLDFSHVGVRGAGYMRSMSFASAKKICSGVSKIADFRHL